MSRRSDPFGHRCSALGVALVTCASALLFSRNAASQGSAAPSGSPSRLMEAQELFQRCKEDHRRVEPEMFKSPAAPAAAPAEKPKKGGRGPGEKTGKPDDKAAPPEPPALGPLEKQRRLVDIAGCYQSVLDLDKEHAGARWNLARVNVLLGRCASAGELYVELGREVSQTDEERKQATDLLRYFRSNCSRIRVMVEDVDSSTFVVKRDGVVVPRRIIDGFPVDTGEHVIEVTAPGKEPWTKTVVVEGVTEYVLRVPALREAPMAFQKKLALGVGGAGVVMLAASGVFLGVARSKWSDAVRTCDPPAEEEAETLCRTTSARLAAGPFGKDAKKMAVASTVLLGAGVAGLATGVVLWFTSPSKNQAAGTNRAVSITLEGGASGGGLSMQGRF